MKAAKYRVREWKGAGERGQYGPAICLYVAANTRYNAAMTVAVLTVGVGINGGIYSGFKVNHLVISPHFAGILMAFTNCLANFTGLLAPIIAGHIIEGRICILAFSLGWRSSSKQVK